MGNIIENYEQVFEYIKQYKVTNFCSVASYFNTSCETIRKLVQGHYNNETYIHWLKKQ